MKKNILLILSCVLCLAACDTVPIKKSRDITETSAKQYTSNHKAVEVYSWKVGKIYNYAIIDTSVPFRNFETITTQENVMQGTDEFIKYMDELPKDKEIYWNLSKIKGFSFPPDEKVQQITIKAYQLGINIIPVNY